MDLITFTHQIAMSLHRVGLAGAGVDMATHLRLGQEWGQDSARLFDKLTKFALKQGMKQFTATNDTDIRRVLYKKLEYPIITKTRKDGLPAVDKPTLKRLMKENPKHPGNKFIQELIDFNAVDKLLSTWIGKENRKSTRKTISELIVPVTDALGLLHFWVFPLRARTGRRASGGGEEGDPDGRNAQNWHPKAKKMIISRWRKAKREGKLAVGDFSKLEMVLMGYVAEDEKLLDFFLNGKGYIGVAKEFWGQDVEDGTPLYKATKSFVLGIGYGMGDFKLAEDLWYRAEFKFSDDWDTHVKRTKKARRKYLRETFKKLGYYMDERRQEVITTQQVVSPTGRIRHLPHHGQPGWNASWQERGHWKHTLNSAINFPIQSFASDATGSAIVDYEKALLKSHGLSYVDWHGALIHQPHDPPASPVFNEVHDELDLDLHPRSGKRDLEILVDCMCNVRSLKKLVPAFNLTLKADVQVVPTWGDAK